MKKILKSFLFTASIILFVLLSSPTHVSGQQGSGCFASDPGMGSTNRDDHYKWAQGQDASRLESNVKSKLNLLYNCPTVNDNAFADAFANYSVIIAQYVQKATCFNNDPGAINTNRETHYNWAKTKSRQQLLQNLQWKITAAFKCLDSTGNKKTFLQPFRC